MRILFLLRSHISERIGGAELQAYLISKYLASKGHEVHYIFESKRNNLNIDNYDKEEGIQLHTLKKRFKKEFSLINYFQLKEAIKEIDPDLIYQRCRSLYTGISVKIAKKLGIKIVFNVASDNDLTNSLDYQNPFNNLNRVISHWGIINADAVILQTNYQLEKIKEMSTAVKTFQVYNGIPINYKKENKMKKKNILWISNIKKNKRPEIFIRLAKENKDIKERFLLAGRPGRSKYDNEILTMLKGTSNIDYLGEILFDETTDLFSSSLIFINTSIYEGFPNTFLQAWENYTPVISINIDPDGIIKKNNIGIIAKNEKDLNKKFKEIIKDRDAIENMGKRGRIYVEKNHDINEVGKKYINIFNEILNDG